MIALLLIILIYLAGIGIFSHIFRKIIRWIQYVDEDGNNIVDTPQTKAIWMAVIWPIVIIPVTTWYVAKQVIK